MQVLYECPTCKSTKSIIKGPFQNTLHFLNHVPYSVPCGWGGCQDNAVRKERE